MAKHLEKRSLALSGHKTSLALETAFWAALEAIAAAQHTSLTGLIAQIDQDKPQGWPLASAVRVFALQHARHQLPDP